MISRDPKCVFVANDVATATVVANWIEHQGIPAKVMDAMTLGGLEGLTAWTGVSARGIEVWVVQPDDAKRAQARMALSIATYFMCIVYAIPSEVCVWVFA